MRLPVLLGVAATAILLGAAALHAPKSLAPASASVSTAPTKADSRTPAPGIGHSKAAPEGPVFALPDGITVENPIRSFYTEDPRECDDKDKDDAYGTGGDVTLCVIFQNHTNAPITVTLPPGLLFVSSSTKIQNGLLVQSASFEVPAGERYFAPLFLHCVNQNRETSGVGDDYALGPVLDLPAFKELYALIEGKTIARRDTVPVGVAVTRLSNGEALRSSDRAALQAL